MNTLALRKGIALAALAALSAAAVVPASAQYGRPKVKVAPALNFAVKNIDGKDVKLGKYQGKVVLMVNVASKCGLTPQYAALEETYRKYKSQGLVILGFPANEFGAQEPGSDAEIKQFCTSTYQVTFPMLSKVVVKGEGICPLYRHLTSKETNPEFAGDIEWNFTKFLIGRDGKIAGRFSPRIAPTDPAFVKAVEAALAAK